MQRCVVSFPKSGRTWLRVMLDELDITAAYTHAGAEHRRPVHFERLTAVLPEQYDKVLVLVRDPRDTLVSAYHHVKYRYKDRRYEGSLSDFIKADDHGILKAITFNLLWAKAAQERGYAMLSYEQMRGNSTRALSEVVSFFGAPRSTARVYYAVWHNRFSAMQTREKRGYYSSRYKGMLDVRDPNNVASFKVRRGKIGSYLDEMTEDEQALCAAAMRDHDYLQTMLRALEQCSLLVPIALERPYAMT